MKTEIIISHLPEEELKKSKPFQSPVVVRVTLEGALYLVDAIIELIKTKYKIY